MSSDRKIDDGCPKEEREGKEKKKSIWEQIIYKDEAVSERSKPSNTKVLNLRSNSPTDQTPPPVLSPSSSLRIQFPNAIEKWKILSFPLPSVLNHIKPRKVGFLLFFFHLCYLMVMDPTHHRRGIIVTRERRLLLVVTRIVVWVWWRQFVPLQID